MDNKWLKQEEAHENHVEGKDLGERGKEVRRKSRGVLTLSCRHVDSGLLSASPFLFTWLLTSLLAPSVSRFPMLPLQTLFPAAAALLKLLRGLSAALRDSDAFGSPGAPSPAARGLRLF